MVLGRFTHVASYDQKILICEHVLVVKHLFHVTDA